MEKVMFTSVFLLFVLQSVSLCTASKLKIINNGYENILVALDSKIPFSERRSTVDGLKNLLQQASSILSSSLKGRSYFRSATFLIPSNWGDPPQWSRANDTSWSNASAAESRVEANLVVVHSSSSRDSEVPYTLHQAGCGRQSLRIYLPQRFVLRGSHRANAVQFVRLWSEFRYGVFLEGGFENDLKYPVAYKTPENTEDKTTGCFVRPNAAKSNSNQCDVGENCDDQKSFSSLMDQHLSNEAIQFCEGHLSLGPRHDPSSPSKHNLLCNEEGTWFTVLRSPDFQRGRNASPKISSDSGMTFRFVRELDAPKVFLAIDVSSKMKTENRYSLTVNAFSHFVSSNLPDNSELSLFTFGGGNSTFITDSVILFDEEARSRYLETQPLPEEPLREEYLCLNCVFKEIFEKVEDGNNTITPSPIVIIVTSENTLNADEYKSIQESLKDSRVHLHVLGFDDKKEDAISNNLFSLQQLCATTGNSFINIDGDLLLNLYNGLAQAVQSPSSNQIIIQDYLNPLDEENLWFKFHIDKSVSKEMRVSLTGPEFGTSPLIQDATTLKRPNGEEIPLKKNLLVPSWDFILSNPEVGKYTLQTRRKEGANSPILVTVYGSPTKVQDAITTRVWVEIADSKISPPPIQIFAEVRKGPYPVINVSVVAYVYHPDADGVSELPLIDDGLGSVDITQDDGVYSHYFTNFTSIGFYNVFIKVFEKEEFHPVILKGPPSDCCGSAFPWSDQQSIGDFQRQAGPATFYVAALPERDDLYPPAKVTDLRIAKSYDQIVVLQWSAVGDDFDAGVASTYELKLFRNRSAIRTNFDNSSLEVYSETIETTPEAAYGRSLFHLLKIPRHLKRGLYFFGIRAFDDVGNSGEPSNAVPIWVEPLMNPTKKDCSNDDLPIADKQTGTAVSLNPFIIFTLLPTVLIFRLNKQ